MWHRVSLSDRQLQEERRRRRRRRTMCRVCLDLSVLAFMQEVHSMLFYYSETCSQMLPRKWATRPHTIPVIISSLTEHKILLYYSAQSGSVPCSVMVSLDNCFQTSGGCGFESWLVQVNLGDCTFLSFPPAFIIM